MEEAATAYPDSATPLEKDEFRILHLEPGLSLKSVRATRTRESLSKTTATPEYTAISYTWNPKRRGARLILIPKTGYGFAYRPANRNGTNSIVLNGEIFHVRASLHEMLKRLRSSHTTRSLWIDALCMNQADHHERGSQMQLMRKIYSSAVAVLAYIDESVNIRSWDYYDLLQSTEVSNTTQTEDTSTTPSEVSTTSGHRTRLRHVLQSLVGRAIVVPTLKLGDRLKPWPFFDVMHHEYWQRVWIQQELFNARNVTFQCRTTILTIDRMYHYQNHLSDYVLPLGLSWFAGSMSHSTETPRTIAVRRSLFNVLAQSCNYRCSDLRDHIYGLLYLSTDYQEGDIVIDYNLSTAEVYKSSVIYILKKYRSLDFILYASKSVTITDPQQSYNGRMPFMAANVAHEATR